MCYTGPDSGPSGSKTVHWLLLDDQCKSHSIRIALCSSLRHHFTQYGGAEVAQCPNVTTRSGSIVNMTRTSPVRIGV